MMSSDEMSSVKLFLIQGLDTALKCCYDDIEETLMVPPEVRRKKHQFQVFTKFSQQFFTKIIIA